MNSEPKETTLDFYLAVSKGVDKYSAVNVFGSSKDWPYFDVMTYFATAEQGGVIKVTGFDIDYNLIEQTIELDMGVNDIGEWFRICDFDIIHGDKITVSNSIGDITGGTYTIGNNQRGFVTSVNSAGVELYIKKLSGNFKKVGKFNTYQFKPPLELEPNTDILVKGTDDGALLQMVVYSE